MTLPTGTPLDRVPDDLLAEALTALIADRVGTDEADELGVAKRSHAAMFKALHEQQSLPLQNVSPQELAQFYAGYGIDPQRYIDTLKSDAVQMRMKATQAFLAREQVPGTPTLIVNGRYLVRGSNFEQLLRNADALIARELAGAKAR